VSKMKGVQVNGIERCEIGCRVEGKPVTFDIQWLRWKGTASEEGKSKTKEMIRERTETVP